MIAVYCFLTFLVMQSESSKVSPKLDFESTDKVTPTDETSPKIHAVRVVVDTTNVKKPIESRSSEEQTQTPNKNDKKIVGIRTDITFEISDENNNSTATAKSNKHAESIDDDEIIPVFKGHGRVQEPNRYDDNNGWHMINIPVFHGTDDEPNRTGGGDWVRFVPITTVWTTERNNYLLNKEHQRRFKPDVNPHVSQKSWKPCRCNDDQVGFRSNQDVNLRRPFVPVTRKVQIDDKLDRTFRDEDK
ncbi:hypothetical protein Bhyg_02174 [Pseudolycoriella hygida]|uniref:Uncharacterized protein n=1 Tax=Pseudolycoriella hygida TaxID=35572 RepID=A0A9Q0S698_9DIPT|nr:hypothetical protein Bhyg_02174 [Pseudolycoriella hygida]